jgi:hypothetical protein
VVFRAGKKRMPWTEEMKAELYKKFDLITNEYHQGWASHDDIIKIAVLCGEDPDDLEDQIDLLEFDEKTNLIDWDEFYDWWSEEVDPVDFI